MSLLDWALEQGNLNEQEDWVKAEFCLLSNRVSPNHPVVMNLTFSNPVYQALAHLWTTGFYSLPALEELEIYSDYYEVPYIKNMLFGRTNSFMPFSRETVLHFNHDVFFESDFGRNIISTYDSEVQYLRDELAKPHFTTTDDLVYYQYMDLTVSCGLALKCLGEDLSVEDKEFISTLDALEPQWQVYHPFLVKELYESV